jgi:hypothetical protein
MSSRTSRRWRLSVRYGREPRRLLKSPSKISGMSLGDCCAPLGAGKQLCLDDTRSRQPKPRCVLMMWTFPRLVSISLQSPRDSPGRKTVVCPVTRPPGAGKLVPAKDGIAVVLIVSSHGGMKMAVPSKLLGDDPSLIRAGGTSSPRSSSCSATTSTDISAITSAMRASERCRSIPTQPCTL